MVVIFVGPLHGDFADDVLSCLAAIFNLISARSGGGLDGLFIAPVSDLDESSSD